MLLIQNGLLYTMETNHPVKADLLIKDDKILKIEEQLYEIELALENGSGNINSLISRQASLQERFIELDGTHYKSKIKSVL